MAEDSQLLLVQAKKYVKGQSDLTMRRRLWLAMMERYGTFQFGASGYDCNWDVQYAQPDLEQFADSDEIAYSNHRAYKQATTDVRGYKMTDSLSLKQNLMNQGEGQIVPLLSQKLTNMVKAARDQFSSEVYIDGNLSGNEQRFHGINSFTGAGACAAGDIVAKNNHTYAGLSTIQGHYGGRWSSDLASNLRPNATLANDWPYGNGKSEYDFWTPKLVNTSSTGWPGGSTSWTDNCAHVLRAIGIWCHCTLGDENSPMMHMMGSKFFNDFKTSFDPALRILVPHKASSDLGFEDALNFEGMAIKYEFDCPADEGYSLTPSAMECFFLTPQLFVSGKSPWFDDDQQKWKLLLYTFGNFRWMPKYFAKFYPIA